MRWNETGWNLIVLDIQSLEYFCPFELLSYDDESFCSSPEAPLRPSNDHRGVPWYIVSHHPDIAIMGKNTVLVTGGALAAHTYRVHRFID